MFFLHTTRADENLHSSEFRKPAENEYQKRKSKNIGY